VIDAIRFNGNKMLQTMVLGALCTYMWMIVGMSFLNQSHKENLCTTMFQCFTSYFYKALRDNGVYEMLDVPGVDFPFPRNVYEAFAGDDSIVFRMVWDLTYQVLFLCECSVLLLVFSIQFSVLSLV